jgi:hypothetical protein
MRKLWWLLAGLAIGCGTGTAPTTPATTTTSQALVVKSISISGVPNPFVAGSVVQLIATATFSDGSTLGVTRQSSWQSSAQNVATVGSDINIGGYVQALSTGSTDIQAAYQGVTTSAQLTVNPIPPIPLSIATLDWHDAVPGCGGKCEQSGDGIFAYCGVAESDGASVTATLTIAWDNGPLQTTTTTFTHGESALSTRNVGYGFWGVRITGAAAFVDSTVPGDPKARIPQAATATCSAVNARGESVTKSIRIPQ